MAAERERDGLVIVLAGVMVQAVDPERVLPQPDGDELGQEQLVVRQGDPVIPDRLVQGKGDPADRRRSERELVHDYARGAGFLGDEHGLVRVDYRRGAVLGGPGDQHVPDRAEVRL